MRLNVVVGLRAGHPPGCGAQVVGSWPTMTVRSSYRDPGVVQAKLSGCVSYRVASVVMCTHFCALRVQKCTVAAIRR